MREALVADCVGKRFGNRWVLRSASLRATRGELRALLGRNGAGKSTLLRIAAGIIAPDSGTVRVHGEFQERATLARLARQGVLFIPDHDLLSSAFTIREHLGFVRSPQDVEGITRVGQEMGIAALLDARPFELSSGERRRAELAFGILKRPACLLADEPLRNVSPIDADALLRAFVALARQGCAVVITGHETPAILGAADHVTWCTAGTTYEMGPPFMARTDERFIRDYLGSRG
ncbi:MAG TPA: ATP-binding cassette domain-containing protein [Gemmatimonadaceae bacterium]